MTKVIDLRKKEVNKLTHENIRLNSYLEETESLITKLKSEKDESEKHLINAKMQIQELHCQNVKLSQAFDLM